MKLKSICAFKNLFDIDCAGCGGTRMFISLIHLDFYQAFRYNPFLFSLIVLGIIYVIYVVTMKLLKRKFLVPNIKWLYVLLVAAAVFMVLRNIPGLEFLLPTEV